MKLLIMQFSPPSQSLHSSSVKIFASAPCSQTLSVYVPPLLRGCWLHITVLNVHASTEDKTDYMKDSFYEELECIFDKFPRYHMKILLGDLMPK
jgi:hypothetical protein